MRPSRAMGKCDHADNMGARQIYLYTNQLADRGIHKMEKKNIVFTKDGARVGVKEMRAEDYADRTQRYVWVPSAALMVGLGARLIPQKSPSSVEF